MSIVERAAEALKHSTQGARRAALRDPRSPSSEKLPSEEKISPDKVITPRQAFLRRLNFTTPTNSRTRQAEEFRLIKRRLLERLAYPPHGPQSENAVLVTSSRPSEGKTFTSINLALSLATDRAGRTLLVEGDVIQPRIVSTFGGKAATGLTDLLVNPSVKLSETILHVKDMNLSILPAGHPVASAADLFITPSMLALVKKLAARFRIVIFDSPPVLATNEASALAKVCSEVLFVINANHTPASAVENALDLLGSEEKVSFILNRSYSKLADQFGSYYPRAQG
jgi:protein-tyrosine kinase